MIASLSAYLNYFGGIRRRTFLAAKTVPDEHLNWSPTPQEFTCGDLIRHIGSVQLMNWRAFAGQPFTYPGHDQSLGPTKTEALAYLDDCNQTGLELLNGLEDDALHAKQPDLSGRPISAWRFLMAAVEHEVHHRSQLDTYLSQLSVPPPQLYGVYMEDLPRD